MSNATSKPPVSTFEFYVGSIILSTSSIDSMTCQCHVILHHQPPSQGWMRKPLALRLKGLIDKASACSRLHLVLREMLAEADSFTTVRNIAAHGWLAVDAVRPMRHGEPTRWLLHASGHDPMSLEQLLQAAQKCRLLSDRISECVAALEFDWAPASPVPAGPGPGV